MPRDAAPSLPGFGEGEITAHPARLVQAVFDSYNEYARRCKWVVTTVLDEGRQRAIRRALPTYGGFHGWEKCLEKASKSEFLMGRVAPSAGHRQFKLHLDFLLQPASIRKLIDGLYNGENDVPASKGEAAGRILPVAMNWRAILETYRPGGRFWPSQQGNRPEGPGPHLAPAEMVEAWRKKHGVTGMVGHNGPQSETLEERLASSIVSLRKHGQYDRANQAEDKLARLQKRPPVLVPAPDAAGFGMPGDTGEIPPKKPEYPRAPQYGWDHPANRDPIRDKMAAHGQPPMDYTEIPEGDPESVEPTAPRGRWAGLDDE